MKMQKEMRKFCPKCKTHTSQSVSIYKKGKDRKSAQGARRHAEDKKGYGGQKFPELKRTAKTTKKLTYATNGKGGNEKQLKKVSGIANLKFNLKAKVGGFIRKNKLIIPKTTNKLRTCQC